MNSTAFIIEQDPSDQHTYLVKHEKGTGDFYYAKHAFRVYADKETKVYNCECMQWEHTGKTITPNIRYNTMQIPFDYTLT